jgi:hypothetical protein
MMAAGMPIAPLKGKRALLHHAGSVSFASLLLIALAILTPVSNVLRACGLGAIGCAGLAWPQVAREPRGVLDAGAPHFNKAK